MEHYVVNKKFLEKLGFDKFEEIEGKRINSWWDLDFIKDRVKEYFIDNQMSLEEYENRIETITSCVLDRMDHFDYSDVNDMIMNEIISETSSLLSRAQGYRQATRIVERIKKDEDGIHRYKGEVGTFEIHNMGAGLFKLVKNYEEREHEDPYYQWQAEVDETNLLSSLQEVLYRETKLTLIQNSKVCSHIETEFPF